MTTTLNVRMRLTRVTVDPAAGKVFGYAVTDDGAEVYIPGIMIEKHDINPQDGIDEIGFTASMMPNPRQGKNGMIAVDPLVWDDEIDVTTQLNLAINNLMGNPVLAKKILVKLRDQLATDGR